MLSVRGFLLVMFKSAFIVAFLTSIPRPVVAFTGFRNWSRKALYTKVDLCTQSCYSQIVPGLYLSNARAAADRNVLRQLGITHILTVEVHKLPKSTFDNMNISTLFIRAYDLPQTYLLPYFPLANAFIEEGLRKGNVLVHCHFGVSRSATLVIAYLMSKYKMSFEQAFVYVRQRRHFINPNAGFVAQLRDYYRMNYDVNGMERFEAYMNVHARKHKYKIASAAAVLFGIVVPAIALVGLYLSNAAAANDRFLLQQLNITHILTVDAQRLPPSTFIGNNIKNLFIMALDTQDTSLLPYFPLSNAFIDEGIQNGNVLVHCRMGISRSTTLVLAFLMEKYKLPFNEAYMLVKKKRPFINPNPGFVRQLRMYEKNNYYVSGFRRLGAYLKVNAGENKIKMITCAVLVMGILIPVAIVLV